MRRLRHLQRGWRERGVCRAAARRVPVEYGVHDEEGKENDQQNGETNLDPEIGVVHAPLPRLSHPPVGVVRHPGAHLGRNGRWRYRGNATHAHGGVHRLLACVGCEGVDCHARGLVVTNSYWCDDDPYPKLPTTSTKKKRLLIAKAAKGVKRGGPSRPTRGRCSRICRSRSSSSSRLASLR